MNHLSVVLCVLVACLLGVCVCRGAEPVAVPPGGTVLLQNIAANTNVAQNAAGKTEPVDVQGPGFEQAVRLTVTTAGNDYDVNRSIPVRHEFKKGEAVLITFWARTIKTRRETGQGTAFVHLSEGQAPWRQEAGRSVTFTDQWQQFFAPGVLKNDYPADRMHLKIFVGNVEQTIEVGGVQLISYGVGFDATKLPRTKSTYDGMSVDAPWRKAAEQRIQEIRTGPIAIQVIGRDGKPVAGANVKATLVSNEFQFGTAVNALDIARGTESKHEVQRQKLVELFNAGTFYNQLKWPAWSGYWGAMHDREVTMAGLRWFREHDLAFRGHVMIWPSFRNLPPFMKDASKDPAALQALALSHIDEIAAATDGLIEEWDVINEPFDNHELMDICGKQVMVDWFKRARERLPKTRLTLNDYALLTPLNDTRKQAWFEETVKYLLESGAPVDVLGLQGHFGGTVPGPERMYATLERFAKLGPKIRITEYDLSTDEPDLKHDFTRDLLITLYSHPAVIGWQTWGINNIIKDDGSFTPEGKAFNDLVHKQWKTLIDAQTDASGKLTSRGHYGRYRIEVASSKRTATVYFDLRKGAVPPIITLP